jgi:glycosyltransferase involved in cell wall biosynthesis
MGIESTTKVCLITTGQPSTNPRLVKEADALSEADYDVNVICAHWARWADKTDQTLLAARRWGASVNYVGGNLYSSEPKHLWSRARYGLTRRVSGIVGIRFPKEWVLSRVTPELAYAARKTRADLYIAHNLGALPAAVHAAKSNGGKVGFDAEDFHSGMSGVAAEDALARLVETEFISACDYLTASSSGIAAAYAETYRVPTPVTLLTVFPLVDRPAEFRERKQDEPLRLYWFSQSIGPGRGLEDVVAAMGELRSRNIELHLRGQWIGRYQAELISFAASKNVDSARIVCHSPAEPDEMARLASQFDVGLALEIPDNRNKELCASNKLFTYMLAGLALVATNTSEQSEILKQKPGIGFLYSPGDITSLAQQLECWLEDSASLALVRRASWKAGSDHFNWDLEKKKFLQVIEDTLAPAAKADTRHVA